MATVIAYVDATQWSVDKALGQSLRQPESLARWTELQASMARSANRALGEAAPELEALGLLQARLIRPAGESDSAARIVSPNPQHGWSEPAEQVVIGSRELLEPDSHLVELWKSDLRFVLNWLLQPRQKSVAVFLVLLVLIEHWLAFASQYKDAADQLADPVFLVSGLLLAAYIKAKPNQDQ